YRLADLGPEAREHVLKETRRGSRFVASGADPGLVEHVAAGGSVRVAEPGGFGSTRTLAGGGRRDGTGLAELMVKALAEGTPSAGGVLVPPEISSELVTLIRARSTVMSMGPTTVPVKKLLNVESMSAGATAYYVAENAAIPTSEETFAETALLAP